MAESAEYKEEVKWKSYPARRLIMAHALTVAAVMALTGRLRGLCQIGFVSRVTLGNVPRTSST